MQGARRALPLAQLVGAGRCAQRRLPKQGGAGRAPGEVRGRASRPTCGGKSTAHRLGVARAGARAEAVHFSGPLGGVDACGASVATLANGCPFRTRWPPAGRATSAYRRARDLATRMPSSHATSAHRSCRRRHSVVAGNAPSPSTPRQRQWQGHRPACNCQGTIAAPLSARHASCHRASHQAEPAGAARSFGWHARAAVRALYNTNVCAHCEPCNRGVELCHTVALALLGLLLHPPSEEGKRRAAPCRARRARSRLWPWQQRSFRGSPAAASQVRAHAHCALGRASTKQAGSGAPSTQCSLCASPACDAPLLWQITDGHLRLPRTRWRRPSQTGAQLLLHRVHTL